MQSRVSSVGTSTPFPRFHEPPSNTCGFSGEDGGSEGSSERSGRHNLYYRTHEPGAAGRDERGRNPCLERVLASRHSCRIFTARPCPFSPLPRNSASVSRRLGPAGFLPEEGAGTRMRRHGGQERTGAGVVDLRRRFSSEICCSAWSSLLQRRPCCVMSARRAWKPRLEGPGSLLRKPLKASSESLWP